MVICTVLAIGHVSSTQMYVYFWKLFSANVDDMD